MGELIGILYGTGIITATILAIYFCIPIFAFIFSKEMWRYTLLILCCWATTTLTNETNSSSFILALGVWSILCISIACIRVLANDIFDGIKRHKIAKTKPNSIETTVAEDALRLDQEIKSRKQSQKIA